MRLVADTKDDYARLALLQSLITQIFKDEKGTGSKIEDATKAFINTSIEKSYEKPGGSIQSAGITEMDTDDRDLTVPYIVQAAINRKKIAIEYKDAKGNVSKRVVEPFNFKNGQLVAFCHERGAWRQFKIPNIVRIAITEDDFERPEDVEITAEDAKMRLF